ncbi:MAG: glycosyltransferase family 4 protein [Planctomycetes bacterium]|nr:glycosyltransferase family 4 protein [Planctomycetota bacterium]
MRIGFETELFDPARGGTEVYVSRFARQMLAAGHEVHLFSSAFREAPAGARLHCVQPYHAAAVQAAITTARLDVMVGSGRRPGMNVVQPHGGTYLGSRRQNLALIRNPILRRMQAWFNSVNPKCRAAARLEQSMYAQQEPRPHFVAISERVRDDMRRDYHVPDERLHVVYHGVDTEQFSPAKKAVQRDEMRRAWGLEPDTVCFLLVAHNFRLKGARELIEAAAQIRRQRRDFAVLIIGKGRQAPFQRLARRLGCGDVVRFPGALREVERAYAAADVYVQPAWYEPFGLVVLEALACGLPVIATRITGAAELMTEGREGYIVESPADTTALASRMLALFDANLRVRMGQSSRALAERHTQQQHFHAMMKVFELAAQESAHSRRELPSDLRRRVA